MLGPCDLAASIGKLPHIYCEENIALVKEIIAKVEAAGGYMGISLGTTKSEEQKFWMELGCRMVSAGTDYDYAVQGALANCRQLASLCRELDK